MARVFKRSLGTIPFVANGVSRFDLPRNNLYKGLLLRLTGTVTVASGAADGTLASEQPQSLVLRAAIVRNGSEYLQSLDGGTLYAIARINSDGDPQRVALAAPGVQSNTAFSVDIPIDFASWRMANASSTLLRGVGTSSLALELTWGPGRDSLTFGSDRTFTFGAATQIEVFSEEILDVTGEFGDKIHNLIERPVSVASTAFAVDLALGQFYRRLILKATDNNGGRLSDAIVNRITLQSDGHFNHFQNVSWAALQGMNKRHYSLASLLAGYAIIDLAEDGNPAGLLDTRGSSSFQAILDVATGTGTTHVRVIPEMVVPANVGG